MAASCYILYSKILKTFYVGATHETVEQRLDKHNNHKYGNHRHTAKTNDWEIFLVFETNDYPHAIRVERKIKSMKSQLYVRNLKKYPELRLKLLNTTST